jgi:hypothetical protein
MKKGDIISYFSRHFELTLVPTILVSITCGIVLSMYLNSMSHSFLDRLSPSIWSLLIITMLTAFIVVNIGRSSAGIRMDVTSPLALYSIFYFLYYILPYLLLFFTDQLPKGNDRTIAFLLSLGYLAYYAGAKCSRPLERGSISVAWLGKREAQVLLGLCIVGIGLVIYAYAWRVSEGIFYNQARFYEQELTVAASFRDVFIMGLQLPIVLFLGLLSAVKQPRIAKISRLLFLIYGFGIFITLTISSQARPAITAFIFIVVAIKLYSSVIIKFRHLILIGLLSTVAVFLLQGVRIVSQEEFASADNQFNFAIQHTLPSGLTGIREFGPEIVERTTSRGGASIIFLSDVINSIKEEEPYLYGRGVFGSLFSLIPRFLWQDKPRVDSPQIVVKTILHLPLTDAPLSPLVQFYANGGWIGIILGYFIFGWLMVKLTNRAIRYPSMGILIIFFFIWSHVVQIEHELLLGMLTTIRNALILYLVYRIAIFLVKDRRISLDEDAVISDSA